MCAVAIALAEGQDAVAPGVDRPIALAVPGSGSLVQVAPPSPDAQAIPAPTGRAAGADGDDRVGQRDDIGDRRRRRRSGSVDELPGEVRRARRMAVAGGASLGEATATGVGAAEAAGASVGATVVSTSRSRPGRDRRREQPGIGRGGAGREGGACPWDAGRAGARDERRNAAESLRAVASGGPRRSRARRSGRSDR